MLVGNTALLRNNAITPVSAYVAVSPKNGAMNPMPALSGNLVISSPMNYGHNRNVSGQKTQTLNALSKEGQILSYTNASPANIYAAQAQKGQHGVGSKGESQRVNPGHFGFGSLQL